MNRSSTTRVQRLRWVMLPHLEMSTLCIQSPRKPPETYYKEENSEALGPTITTRRPSCLLLDALREEKDLIYNRNKR